MFGRLHYFKVTRCWDGCELRVYFILIMLQATMSMNVVLLFVIALGSIGATFGGVLYFEPKSSGTVSTVICPDGGTCPGSDTCCILGSLKYGCCPLPRVSADNV